MYALIVISMMISISFMIFPNLPIESLAHRDGCHRWHSCPSDDGSYVCGDLGYDDECGGSEEEDTDTEEDIETTNDDSSSKDDDKNGNEGVINSRGKLPASSDECQGQADCFTGRVTDIVDGDTLDVNNIRVRLSLVNTPERADSGYQEAKEFTESICPIGSKALVDEDDGQKEGSYDRLIGLVYCGNERQLLNEHLLNEGHAQIFGDFCGASEFSNEAWVREFGC